jgi:subtilisin family serine protease
VVDHGARVVNLSVGAGGSVITSILGGGSSSLADGVEYAWNSGAIPVLASGNDQAALLGGSANYGSLDAMVVGATGPNDEVAGYSSPLGNAKWGLVAPGGDGGGDTAHQIASTFWVRGMSNQYAVLEGTSMAAPHVTAAAALLLAQGLSRDQAVQRLLDSANRGVACGGGCHGRLDVLQAVGGPAPATAPSAATPAAPATTARPAAAPAAAPTTAAPAPATTAPPTTAAPATTTAPSSPPSTEPSNTNVAVRLLTPKGKGGGLGEDHPVLLAVAILSVLSAGGLTAMSLVRRVR